MSRLWSYLRRYRPRYLAGVACLLAARALSMTVPWLLGRSLDVIAAIGRGVATTGTNFGRPADFSRIMR